MNNLALFIDFENLAHRRKLDVQRLLGDLHKRGALSIKRAYADWGRFAAHKREMLESSVELVELPAHGKRGKNSSDIRLVVDAMEAALTRPHLDTFVIISSDSDFIPLISKLREFGKRVLVMGIKADMSPLLPNYCDELIYLDASPVATQALPVSRVDRDALALFRRALDAIEGGGTAWCGAKIKKVMREHDATFDEKKLGFSRFKAFAEAAVRQSPGLRIEAGSGGDFLVVDAARPGPAPGARSMPRPAITPVDGEDAAAHTMTQTRVVDRITSIPLARKVWDALVDGPLPANTLAQAVKAAHFADDDNVSALGLRSAIRRFMSDGLLTEIELNGERLVTRAAAGMA